MAQIAPPIEGAPPERPEEEVIAPEDELIEEEAIQPEGIPENVESLFFENLAKGMSKDNLERIGQEVVEGFEIDKDSLSELEEMRVKYNKLFNMVPDEKTYPWEDASNVLLPNITKACINFQARASINLFSPANHRLAESDRDCDRENTEGLCGGSHGFFSSRHFHLKISQNLQEGVDTDLCVEQSYDGISMITIPRHDPSQTKC